MGFWIQLAQWFVVQLIGQLFIKGPRQNQQEPPGLGDVQAPTADERRPVQIFCGTVEIRGPNVLWYGDIEAERQTKKVRVGWLKKEEVFLGYKIFLGVHLGFGEGPVDEVRKILVEKDVLWEGVFTTSGDVISVDDPEFFGGDDGPRANGGFVGDFRVYLGTNPQPVNSYLNQFLNPMPGHNGIFHMVLEHGWIGNQPTLQPWSVEACRWPNQLGVTGGKHRIGDCANPICFLFEILTNTRWGRRKAFSRFDLVEWRDLAETIHDEGLGFSYVLDSLRDTDEVIGLLQDHVDGVLFTDPRTNLIRLKLARDDYVLDDLPVFDRSNAKLVDFTRGDWRETFNMISVEFEDRDQGYSTRPTLHIDPANVNIQGEEVPHTQAFAGAKTSAVAQIITDRQARALTSPLGKGEISMNRMAWQLNPGDVFKLNWPPRGIQDMACRIQQIRPGTPESGRIVINFMQDIYGLGLAIFTAVQPSGWVPPQTAPAPAIRQRLWEVPYQLLPDDQRDSYLATLVTRPGGLHQSYQIHADLTGGSDFVQTNSSTQFTPSGMLDGSMLIDLGDVTPFEQTVTLDGLVDAAYDALVEIAAVGLDPLDPANLILVDSELMWFESVTDNGGGSVDLVDVHRGAMDTVPQPHSDGSLVWFVGVGAGLVTEDPIDPSVTAVAVRVLPQTDRGTLDIGLASTMSHTMTGRVGRPVPPADPMVNGNRVVDLDGWTRTPGTLAISWSTRNRDAQPLDTAQDDPPVAQSGGVRTNLRLRRADNDVTALTQTGVPGGGFVAQGFVPEASPGIPDTLEFYLEVESQLAGAVSDLWVSRDFEVFGFGARFGEDFGGSSGGIVLDQGDPPFLPDPIPGQGSDRQWRISVGGIYNAADRLDVSVIATDTLAGENLLVDFSLSGAVQLSLGEYSEEIESQLNALLVNRPFTVVRQGLTVTVSSRFGNLSVRQESTAAPGGLQATYSLRQAAAPPLAPVPQVIYVDYWTTEDDSSGVRFDVLAPSSDQAYATTGEARVQTEISPITYGAELVLEGRNRTLNTAVSMQPLISNYNGEFPDIAQALGNSPLADLFSVSVGLATGLPIPQVRSAVVLVMEPNFRASTQLFDSHPILNPSGYKLLFREGRSPSAGDPAGLAQVVTVGFNLSGSGFTGLDYVVSVGSDVFSREVQAPGDQTELVAALDLLTSDIDAAPGLGASRTDGTNFRYDLTVLTAAAVSADVFAHATYGLQVEFLETT